VFKTGTTLKAFAFTRGDSGWGPGFCNKCKYHKTEADYHCPLCDVCVIGYDHHCVFFSKCIAKGNINEFRLSILCSIVLTVYFGAVFTFAVVLKWFQSDT